MTSSFFLDSLVFLLIYLFLCQYHTGLISAILEYVLVSGRASSFLQQ